MKKLIWLTSILVVLFLSSGIRSASASETAPRVRLILFWMESCGHCHAVMDEVLPPLQAQYGEQLEVALVELVTLDEVNLLYSVAAAYDIPKSEVKVPVLLIGDNALVGAQQITDQLPALIDLYLASGGVDYPDLADLKDVLPALSTEDEACRIEQPCEDDAPAYASTSDEAGGSQAAKAQEDATETAPLPVERALGGPLAAAAFAAGGVFTLIGLGLIYWKRTRRS